MPGPHVLVAISGHGLGHLSQASAVINALNSQSTPVRFTVRCPLATNIVQRWIHPAVSHCVREDDVGMRMTNALDVDLGASHAVYAALHDRWALKVSELAEWLVEQGVALVLSDIAYLPLAAAQKAGIPNVALCSLNWADVMGYYLSDGKAEHWLAQATQAYQQADCFLQPTPSMPMPWLRNTRPIAPIGHVGRAQRDNLRGQLGLPGDCYLVLVGMGGMGLELNLSEWPRMVDGRPVHYLVPDGSLSETRADRGTRMHAISASRLPYHDLMASADAIVTKPGYGTFVDAAANGLPVLYVMREGWPDVESLTQWLGRVGRGAGISRSAFEQGELTSEITELLRAGRYTAVAPEGAAQAAEHLVQYLDTEAFTGIPWR